MLTRNSCEPRPSASGPDMRDGYAADAVLSSNHNIRSRVLADRTHSNGVQLGLAVAHAERETHLRIAVSRVVLRRTKEQVARPHTRRVVASVQNLHPCRYRAVDQLPGDAMRLEYIPPYPEVTVPFAMARSCPHPTPFRVPGLTHELLEPYVRRSRWSRWPSHQQYPLCRSRRRTPAGSSDRYLPIE